MVVMGNLKKLWQDFYLIKQITSIYRLLYSWMVVILRSSSLIDFNPPNKAEAPAIVVQ